MLGSLLMLAQIAAEGHISIATEIYGNADTDAGVTTGAVVGTIGKSDVRVNFVQNAQTTIGAGASVQAGGNLSVTTENRHVAITAASAPRAATTNASATLQRVATLPHSTAPPVVLAANITR